MAVFAGPEISNSGLVLHLDAANNNSYSSYENLYPTSEDMTSFFPLTGGTYTTSTTGGPFNGKYATITVTSTNHYLFEWGNTITLTTGTTVTQSWYIKPVTDCNNIYLRFWSGTNRPWSGNAYAYFNLSATSVVSITGEVSTATIQRADNNWIRISATAQTTSSGFSAFSLYGSGVVSTTTVYNVAGPQLVKKSYPGVYTPTYGSAIAASTVWTNLTNQINTGTLVNSPAYISNNSGYINFDYTLSQFISFTTSTSVLFLGTASYTLETWAQPTINPGFNNWIGFFNRESNATGVRDGYNIHMVEYPTTGTITLSAERFVTTGTTISASESISTSTFLNTWNHIVATYDGSYLRLYRNGLLKSTSAIGTGSIANSVQTLQVGQRNGNYFRGNIAVAKIYDRVLSAVEIRQNFETHRDRYGI